MKPALKILVSLLLIIYNANAQENNSLSLADAIKTALENNYSIRIATDQTAIARNNNTWGEAGRYPTIDLQVTQNNNINDQSNNPTSFIQDKIISNSLAGNIAMNWVLFSGFRVRINKERLELIQAQSEGNALIIVENTIQSVILGYYNAVLQKEKMDVLKKVIRLSRDKYQHSMLRQDVGIATTFDLLQLKNAFLIDSTNYLLQEIAYKNSMRNLNLLMAADVDKDYVLTDFLKTIKDTYDFDTLKARMTRNNLNVLNQFINIELQKSAVELS